MDLDELEAKKKKEVRNIKKLIPKGTDKARVAVLMPMIENTAWMKAKLDDMREKIKCSDATISYDNGGGQEGIKENPEFKAYESLWKSYLSGMDRLLKVISEEKGKGIVKEAAESQTVLELVRNKHRKKA